MTSSEPPGCLGLAHPSGWVNGETFLKALQHFVKISAPSKSNPHLLLLDNHSSHLPIIAAVISFAKENGIVMLSLPPPCSHRLQPLNVSVFGPSSQHCSKVSTIVCSPGRKISIHEIVELTRDSYLQRMTPSRIQDFPKPEFISIFYDSLLTDYFKFN